ncbi:thioredoxin family protein [Azonexus sp.]|uniref:thioredoxin family protein n=1 Tax=Azonexus sp. TaxID=1872668 RepID=UPI0027BAEEF2|nr:thioredoxin family protein [Azonexus sp.]
MRQSWKGWNGLIGALILACLPTGTLQAAELQRASHLAVEARQAASAGAPLVIIFSRADCSFCKTVKRDYLRVLAADPRYAGRVVIREVAQDSNAPLQDFSGRPTTHAIFAKREKIRLVPVVAFYGPDGQALHEPIVGARLPDFYQSYLEDAVDQASLALKKR